MKIISFTGKSGTGKSFQATALAQKRNIDAIIDDGLLIYKGQIVAGTSAKKSPSKREAMRIALFNHDWHRSEVVQALVKYHPETLMIIGTSDKMTNIVCESLGLHEPEERIYIEDVTTEEQRETAHYYRHIEGEHVIPAPMGQLKRDFAGYFMNPLRIFKAAKVLRDDNATETEEDEFNRTVVRPQYSYFGVFTITEQALKDIVSITAEKYKDRLAVLDRLGNGKQENMVVAIDVRLVQGPGMVEICEAFQKDVHQAIEDMTSFSVEAVNIRIRDIRKDAVKLHA
ncbi:MAG: hypothetical protein KBS56_04660 [Clostridiales bacterium]|nr:hypothetical protein [Candidatus Crickella equi]